MQIEEEAAAAAEVRDMAAQGSRKNIQESTWSTWVLPSTSSHAPLRIMHAGAELGLSMQGRRQRGSSC